MQIETTEPLDIIKSEAEGGRMQINREGQERQDKEKELNNSSSNAFIFKQSFYLSPCFLFLS
jgi:hypothetical protein